MNDFEQMMKDLLTEYLAELPKRIEEIQLHFSNQQLDSLQDDFHKLKGTGKTYGVPEISELCAEVEALCIHQPKTIDQVIPNAISLLSDIQKERTENRAFNLIADQRFNEIKSF